MYTLSTTSQFKKDYKLCQTRKFDLKLLDYVFSLLELNGHLPSAYKQHKLKGNYNGFWESHIKPDWLLIWHINDKPKEIVLVRTGTHADLF